MKFLVKIYNKIHLLDKIFHVIPFILMHVETFFLWQCMCTCRVRELVWAKLQFAIRVSGWSILPQKIANVLYGRPSKDS